MTCEIDGHEFQMPTTVVEVRSNQIGVEVVTLQVWIIVCSKCGETRADTLEEHIPGFGKTADVDGERQ